MSTTHFNRDSMASWYARNHLKTDDAIQAIYYLPNGAPEREIRFIEINDLLAEKNDEALEPIDFGVDMGMETQHQLFVLDVSNDQWDRILKQQLELPTGWSLEDKRPFTP